MSATTVYDRARYRANPSVLQALKNPRMLTREVLAGLVVGLALIPEAIAFSVIAGVDPKVGLFSSFIMAVSIAFLGGRPAMVTAATGAVALVIAPVAPTYGLDYFIATVILAGVFQVILGVLGVAKLMRFIPRSVMVGFVNALAIFVFSSQFPQLIDVITGISSASRNCLSPGGRVRAARYPRAMRNPALPVAPRAGQLSLTPNWSRYMSTYAIISAWTVEIRGGECRLARRP
jgi:hypothetical protein